MSTNDPDVQAVWAALEEVEGRHHIFGEQCLCGEQQLRKNRDRTKHIARATIAALMGPEIVAEVEKAERGN